MQFTRWLVGGSGVAIVAALVAAPGLRAGSPAERPIGPEITVYHSPSCGCCKKWITYLEQNGFTVKSIERANFDDIKAEGGVTPALRSCHTALVQGYVIEGHVPVADIQRLLKEKPKVLGLSAPGMPGASPGMDVSKEPYQVLTFDAKGNTALWAKH